MYGVVVAPAKEQLHGPHRLCGSRVTKLTHTLGSRLAFNLRYLPLHMSVEHLRTHIPDCLVPSEDAAGAIKVSQEALKAAAPTLGVAVCECCRFWGPSAPQSFIPTLERTAFFFLPLPYSI